MSDILKEKRLHALNTWQVILIIVGIIFTLGGTWQLNSNKISNVENKVEVHEQWIKDHDRQGQSATQTMIEIQINLRNVCEKLKVPYQTADKIQITK